MFTQVQCKKIAAFFLKIAEIIFAGIVVAGIIASPVPVGKVITGLFAAAGCFIVALYFQLEGGD